MINCNHEEFTNNSNGEDLRRLERRVERLQEQNRMLTNEIGRKDDRVTALEQEKRSLIRQLFTLNTKSNFKPENLPVANSELNNEYYSTLSNYETEFAPQMINLPPLLQQNNLS